MKFSLFRSGWAPRVGVAVAYAILAFGSVALVTRPAPAPPEAVAADDSATTTVAGLIKVHVVIDSVQPVAEWTVRNTGEIIAPQTVEAMSWEAEWRCAAVDLSILTTTVAGPGTNALRVRLETDTRREDLTFWCPGDCAISVTPDDFPVDNVRDSTP